MSQVNNNLGIPPPIRAHRTSNAGPINVKDVFDVNGGPNSQIYGVGGGGGGHVNQAYEPVVEDGDPNSLRLKPRTHQVQWSGNK